MASVAGDVFHRLSQEDRLRHDRGLGVAEAMSTSSRTAQARLKLTRRTIAKIGESLW